MTRHQGLSPQNFDQLSEHVVITDSDAIILYANTAASKTTKFSLQEIMGKNPSDLWGGHMPQEFYTHMWKTIKEQKYPFVGQVKNLRRDGAEQWQEMYITPLLDEKGKAQYFVSIEYVIPQPIPAPTLTPWEQKAALIFNQSPSSLLLIVAGENEVKFYRSFPLGLQLLNTVFRPDDPKRMGLYLHECGKIFETFFRKNIFDAVYLFSPVQFIESWKTLFRKLSITPAAIMVGDYAQDKEPQLLEKVRVHIYSGI